jgi:hypothetical protein
MQATLSEGAKAARLKPGVQRAIAASASDAALAVQLELISILDGAAFRGSSRSCAFLRFVVEEALAGSGGMLKERIIGTAVLGKPSNYDTGADSGVRVRANDVRKRLSVHYEATAPKGGIRIELPPGTYTPKFTQVTAPVGEVVAAQQPQAPPMLLWQLALPTLVAVFLALITIRADVESSDAFSRFWNQAMAGRTEILVALDAEAGASISPAMADAAMPLERLASALQVPIHIVAAGAGQRPESCLIRLSLSARPAGREAFRLGRATVFRGSTHEPAVWVWAESAEALRSAAQILTSRSGFPEVE